MRRDESNETEKDLCHHNLHPSLPTLSVDAPGHTQHTSCVHQPRMASLVHQAYSDPLPFGDECAAVSGAYWSSLGPGGKGGGVERGILAAELQNAVPWEGKKNDRGLLHVSNLFSDPTPCSNKTL